jgi:hypothetical protein
VDDHREKKKIYWQLVKIKPQMSGVYWIEYWSKPDRSNVLREKFVQLTEERIRQRIEVVTGQRNFDLVEFKE